MATNIQNRTFFLSHSYVHKMYHSTPQNPPVFFILFLAGRGGNDCEKGKSPVRCSFEKSEQNITMNTDIRLLSVPLLIDAPETKGTGKETKTWTRVIISHPRDFLELRLVKKQ